MIYGLETPLFIGRVLLVIAALCSTIFPLLYARAPWYTHRLGRAIMILAIAMAVTLWRSVFLTFFARTESRDFILWLNVAMLIAIIVATSKLSLVQWSFIREALQRRKNERNDPGLKQDL